MFNLFLHAPRRYRARSEEMGQKRFLSAQNIRAIRQFRPRVAPLQQLALGLAAAFDGQRQRDEREVPQAFENGFLYDGQSGRSLL